MAATVVRLPDGSLGRELLAELHRRLPAETANLLKIRSYAGQAMLFVPDDAWRETWMEETLSRFGATIVAFDVPAKVADRRLPPIVIEALDPADTHLRDLVAALLLRRGLHATSSVGASEAAAAALLRDVEVELRAHVPDASIRVARARRPDAEGRAIVWRVTRGAEARG